MRRDLAVICALWVVGVAAVVSCSASQRRDARTAVELADEACDVLVLLDDGATWACLGVDTLQGVAERLMVQRGKSPVGASSGRVLRPASAGAGPREAAACLRVARPGWEVRLVDGGAAGAAGEGGAP